MKKFILPEATEYQKKLCKLFAEYSVITNVNEYQKRNQYNQEKIKKDIYQGKLSEFMVFNFLLNSNKTPYPPDIMVYNKRNKSFDCDLLTTDNVKIHVKSCSNKSRYPNSWLFQPQDPLTIVPKENNFIFLTVLDAEKPYTYIHSAKDVIDWYKPPLKKELNKKVIYEEDIIKNCKLPTHAT